MIGNTAIFFPKKHQSRQHTMGLIIPKITKIRQIKEYFLTEPMIAQGNGKTFTKILVYKFYHFESQLNLQTVSQPQTPKLRIFLNYGCLKKSYGCLFGQPKKPIGLIIEFMAKSFKQYGFIYGFTKITLEYIYSLTLAQLIKLLLTPLTQGIL